jgi:hypothetical protein
LPALLDLGNPCVILPHHENCHPFNFQSRKASSRKTL